MRGLTPLDYAIWVLLLAKVEFGVPQWAAINGVFVHTLVGANSEAARVVRMVVLGAVAVALLMR